MILQMFSIYDSVVGAYMRPFFMQNRAVAVREVCRAIEDPSSELAKNAKDCALYYIGEFDDYTGVMHPNPQPVSLGNITDWIQRRSEFEEVFTPPHPLNKK